MVSYIIIVIFTTAVFLLGKKLKTSYSVNTNQSTVWICVSLLKFVLVSIVFLWFGTSLDPHVWGDTVMYYNTARSLSSGALSYSNFLSNLEWPPHVGYQIFLSLLFKLTGPSEYMATFINTFLSVLVSYFAYHIAAHFVDKRTAMNCCILIDIYPLTIQFSYFVLKDISIMLLMELCILFALKLIVDKNHNAVLPLIISIVILLFYRSFYSIFIILWLFTSFAFSKSTTGIKKLLFVLSGCFLLFVGIKYLGSESVNAGYTIGGQNSGLPFINEIRLDFTFSSILSLFTTIIKNIFPFILYVFEEMGRIFLGPFYWESGQIVYLHSFENANYRYVLFENLGAIFMILIFPGFFLAVKQKMKGIMSANTLVILIIILGLSQIIAADVRWKLSLMPYLIMICWYGMTKIIRSRVYVERWLLFEGVFFIAMFIRMIISH